ERREVEDRLEPHRLAVRLDGPETEGALERDVVADPHHDGRARDNLLLDRLCKPPFHFGPVQVSKTPLQITGDSANDSFIARESSCARNPNGIARFSVVWPASIPHSTGQSRPAVCSAIKPPISRRSWSPSAAGRPPKTIPATSPSAPDCLSCTSIR